MGIWGDLGVTGHAVVVGDVAVVGDVVVVGELSSNEDVVLSDILNLRSLGVEDELTRDVNLEGISR